MELKVISFKLYALKIVGEENVWGYNYLGLKFWVETSFAIVTGEEYGVYRNVHFLFSESMK